MTDQQRESECRHCGRPIVETEAGWVDPEATGDDAVWGETCDAHDTFEAKHEPTICAGGCDEPLDPNDAMYSEIIEDSVCQGCEESDGNHVSTILRFSPDGEHQRVLLGDLFAYSGTLDDVNDSQIPQWLTDLFPDGEVKRHYVRTDGWRGHFDTSQAMTGITKIADGWLTGDWGDEISDRKATARDLGEFLAEGDQYPPKPLYVILEPTSNVFSMATELFTKDADRDEVAAWLAENGYPVDDLERSLR